MSCGGQNWMGAILSTNPKEFYSKRPGNARREKPDILSPAVGHHGNGSSTVLSSSADSRSGPKQGEPHALGSTKWQFPSAADVIKKGLRRHTRSSRIR